MHRKPIPRTLYTRVKLPYGRACTEQQAKRLTTFRCSPIETEKVKEWNTWFSLQWRIGLLPSNRRIRKGYK